VKTNREKLQKRYKLFKITIFVILLQKKFFKNYFNKKIIKNTVDLFVSHPVSVSVHKLFAMNKI
jgi:predicted lactoylglutathione lyase